MEKYSERYFSRHVVESKCVWKLQKQMTIPIYSVSVVSSSVENLYEIILYNFPQPAIEQYLL